MRQSELFTKTRKEIPKDEVSKSAQLLLRAGFIHKELAGVYAFLPLGLRVLSKLTEVIRKEMNEIGGQEVSLTALQDPELWKKSDRWDDAKVDTWFKTKLKNATEIGLGFTHEESLARIMKNYIGSYRDLPKFVYQFQNKFRNELRAKSGLLRGREFLMKDLYSFTATTEQLDTFYEQAAGAYQRIFKTVGIGDVTYKTFASGGVFTKFSHEFQTLTDAGEDTIYIAKDKSVSINKEVFNDEVLAMFKKTKQDFEEHRAIEVGNIFKLGTRFAEAVGLQYSDESGKMHPVVMGSYGIGVPRLMATVVEVLADKHGMVWPKAIAPFDVHIVAINPKDDSKVTQEVEALVRDLEKKDIPVLVDDRHDISAGQQLKDSDLIGIPTRVVVSEKTVAAKKLELKNRAVSKVTYRTRTQFIKEVV